MELRANVSVTRKVLIVGFRDREERLCLGCWTFSKDHRDFGYKELLHLGKVGNDMSIPFMPFEGKRRTGGVRRVD